MPAHNHRQAGDRAIIQTGEVRSVKGRNLVAGDQNPTGAQSENRRDQMTGTTRMHIQLRQDDERASAVAGIAGTVRDSTVLQMRTKRVHSIRSNKGVGA
jgi:hypothetical protein